MRLMKNQQQRIRHTEQRGYVGSKEKPRRRYRRGYFVLVFLAILILVGLGAYLSSGPSEETSDGPSDKVDAPVAVEQAPKEPAAEDGEDEAATEAPTDPTMYLTVPKLGIHDALVLDDVSEEAGWFRHRPPARYGFPLDGGLEHVYCGSPPRLRGNS